MAREPWSDYKNKTQFKDLLQYFNNEELKELFDDKTKLALNKTALAELSLLDIRILKNNIDVLADEIQERKMDMSPRPLLRKPKNYPMRFSDQISRKKVDILEVFYRKEREKQRKAVLSNLKKTIGNAKKSLKIKEKRSESPKRKIDLTIVGKAVKLFKVDSEEEIHHQENDKMKKEPMNKKEKKQKEDNGKSKGDCETNKKEHTNKKKSSSVKKSQKSNNQKKPSKKLTYKPKSTASLKPKMKKSAKKH